METDVPGRIRNTKLARARALLPMFEAVVNSIHAVADAISAGFLQPGRGQIEVRLARRPSQGVLRPTGDDHPMIAEPIEHVTITDNGIGFNEANYRSFLTADSRQKVTLGGRGIGRFLWLVAFDHAEIDSVHLEAGETRRRKFSFINAEEAIQRANLEDATDAEAKTSVRLVGLRPHYQDSWPRQAALVGKRIIEHCLNYMVVGDCPRLILVDESNAEQIDLNALFETDVQAESASQTFGLRGRPFEIRHIRIAARHGVPHQIHFCANRRVVRTEALDKRLPNLEDHLSDPGGVRPFVYAGYVSGTYLDHTVAPDRTAFELPEEGTLAATEEISWPELLDGSAAQAAGFLSPFTQPVNEAKHERIRQFVHTRAPQYRRLLKHKAKAIDRIPSQITDDRLDVELYKIEQEYDAELRSQYQALLGAFDSDVSQDFDAHQKQFETFLEEWNEAGVSRLARHVVHRRATLSFLEASLRAKPDGRYALENAIHQIVFPLRATSDDIAPDQMNLWIIDERLAFHYYLASDKRLDQISEAVGVKSAARPDVIIFNNPSAFVVETDAAFGSIVLIEFKRPARDDYADDENPIAQIYDYIRDIKSGRSLDRHGRPISVSPKTPFFAFAVCDLTQTLRKQAENARLTLMPDAQGYVGFNDNLGVYIEVVSFNKLLADAKRRNAVLFDKLGMPTASAPL